MIDGCRGREHETVRAHHRRRAEIDAAMANQDPGIRRRSKDVLLVDVTAVDHIVEWASERRAELAVIGPEAPLEKGIADALEKAGIPTVGPTREAAQLEMEKEFTRTLMQDHGIPACPPCWAL